MSRMNGISSSYYPKRARWHSRFVYPWLDLMRALHLEAIHLPSGISGRDFLLGLIWPGHAFGALGKKLYGKWLKLLYALATLVFVMALGHFAGTVAFGVMVSIHTISILFLLAGWLVGLRWGARCALALTTLGVLGQFVYQPLLRQMARHVAVPLKVGGRVIVVDPRASASRVRVGDTVVYAIEEQRVNGLLLGSGFGMEKVLARGGDHVRFGPEEVEVNGKVFPRQPQMPSSGEVIVPGKHWLIGPRFIVSGGHGQANLSANISVAMWQAAMVSESHFTGRPYQRWFWSKQTLP